MTPGTKFRRNVYNKALFIVGIQFFFLKEVTEKCDMYITSAMAANRLT
jgi:hypothetical protein